MPFLRNSYAGCLAICYKHTVPLGLMSGSPSGGDMFIEIYL